MSLKIRWMAILAVAASTVLSVPALPHSQAQERAATPAQGPLRFTKGSLDHFSFKMVRSTAVVQAGCLLTATGAVTISRQAQNVVMQVTVSGVAPSPGCDRWR